MAQSFTIRENPGKIIKTFTASAVIAWFAANQRKQGNKAVIRDFLAVLALFFLSYIGLSLPYLLGV